MHAHSERQKYRRQTINKLVTERELLRQTRNRSDGFVVGGCLTQP